MPRLSYSGLLHAYLVSFDLFLRVQIEREGLVWAAVSPSTHLQDYNNIIIIVIIISIGAI